MTEQRTEEVETIRYLTEESGVSEEEARLMMRDPDLWILDPAARYGYELEGEEGVRHWQAAYELAQDLAEFATNKIDLSNPALTQLANDAAERARERAARA